MASNSGPKVAFVFRGDPKVPSATPDRSRGLGPLLQTFADAGLRAEPVAYADEYADETRDRLLGYDGVLVWVNPIEAGEDRSKLDPMLREVADGGVFVSAHPDVVLAMGTKEILHRTRELGWGCDTHLYETVDDLRRDLPVRLDGGPRVLKQYRGNGGNGTFKVEHAQTDGEVILDHAMQWSGLPKTMTLDDFFDRMQSYFEGTGRLIEQPFMPRLDEGLVRVYLVHDEVVGFTHQYPRGLLSARSEELRSAPLVRAPMADVDVPTYQALRWKVEHEWVPQMSDLLALERDELPVIWDADFLFGPRSESGEDTYVLCEINVSAVWPFPEQACGKLAAAASARVRGGAELG